MTNVIINPSDFGSVPKDALIILTPNSNVKANGALTAVGTPLRQHTVGETTTFENLVPDIYIVSVVGPNFIPPFYINVTETNGGTVNANTLIVDPTFNISPSVFNVISASFSTTASFAMNGGGSGSGSPLVTGSTYQITSSHSVTGSYLTDGKGNFVLLDTTGGGRAFVSDAAGDELVMINGSIGLSDPNGVGFSVFEGVASVGTSDNGINVTTSSVVIDVPVIASGGINGVLTSSVIVDGNGNSMSLSPGGIILQDNIGDFLSFGYFDADPNEPFPGFVQLSDNSGGGFNIYQGALGFSAGGVDAIDITSNNATFNIPIQVATAITTSAIATNNVLSAGGNMSFPNGINIIGQDPFMSPDITNVTIAVNGSPLGHGRSGDCGLNVSNYSTSSGNSGAAYNINVHSASGVVMSGNSVSWVHVPTNRTIGLLPGWTYTVLNPDPVNVKGYGVCAPSLSGFDTGNYSMLLCDMVSKLFRVPFWVRGIYQPTDIVLSLTVNSMSNAPVFQDVYTSGSSIYTVEQSNLSGAPGFASGNILFLSASAPHAPGILTRASGSGDTHISYSAVTTFGWRDSLSVNPFTGLVNISGSLNAPSITGSVISCSLVTASMFSSVTSSTSPVNSSSVAKWTSIQMNGQTYFMPLYQ
jgi:hypothetical protein